MKDWQNQQFSIKWWWSKIRLELELDGTRQHQYQEIG